MNQRSKPGKNNSKNEHQNEIGFPHIQFQELGITQSSQQFQSYVGKPNKH